MFGLKKMVAVALAAACVSVPTLATADNDYDQWQGYNDRDRSVEQLGAQIQRDRFSLQQAEQARDWGRVRQERREIMWRERRLHQMLMQCNYYRR